MRAMTQRPYEASWLACEEAQRTTQRGMLTATCGKTLAQISAAMCRRGALSRSLTGQRRGITGGKSRRASARQGWPRGAHPERGEAWIHVEHALREINVRGQDDVSRGDERLEEPLRRGHFRK